MQLNDAEFHALSRGNHQEMKLSDRIHEQNKKHINTLKQSSNKLKTIFLYKQIVKNPFDPNSQDPNPGWNNGCSTTKGKTSFYGNNKGQFLIWSNTGDSKCIESSIQFPL